MKKIAMIGLVSFAVSAGAVASDSSNLKIGLVNPIAIYQVVPEGEEKIQALQTKLMPRADELQKQRQDLMTKIQTWQKNSPTLTKLDLDQQQNELIEEQDKFTQEVMAFRQSEVSQEQKISEEFQASFNKAVAVVAKEFKYSFILSSQAVAYAAPDLKVDVTDQVISQMKKQDVHIPVKEIT